MPTGRHARTIDLGKKLSSFLTAPPIHNTKVMDELNHLILHEPSFTNRDELSHTLSLIFQSCTVEVPKAKDLVVPLTKIPPDSRLDDLDAFPLAPGGAPMVQLYNTQKCQWNWPLPTMHGQGRTTKKSEQGGTESGTKEKLGEWVLIDEMKKPSY